MSTPDCKKAHPGEKLVPRRVGMDPVHGYPTTPPFSQIDRPTGRIEGTVSAVTGKPLRYFVPDLLQELIERCRDPSEQRIGIDNPYLSFALVRAASRRDLGGEVDTIQAARFCEIIARQKTYKSKEQLVDLGRHISSKNNGLREEIVFAGARTPSDAKHIYAPYSMLPSLMDSLVRTLSDGVQEMDPGVVAGVVGFYCTHVHPFLDGNGRWARLIAASAGMNAEATMPAMISVVFQNACKAELINDVWPDARSFGLRRYVALAKQFEGELLARLKDRNVLQAVSGLNAEIYRSAKNRRDFCSLASKIYSDQGAPLGQLRGTLGLSARAFSGLVEKVLVAADGLVDADRDRLDISQLLSRVDDEIVKSRECIFNRSFSDA